MADLEVLYGVDLHLIHDLGCLIQQHLDDANMVLDVEVRREHAVTQDLVEEFGLRRATVWLLRLSGLGFFFPRQAQ